MQVGDKVQLSGTVRYIVESDDSVGVALDGAFTITVPQAALASQPAPSGASPRMICPYDEAQCEYRGGGVGSCIHTDPECRKRSSAGEPAAQKRWVSINQVLIAHRYRYSSGECSCRLATRGYEAWVAHIVPLLTEVTAVTRATAAPASTPYKGPINQPCSACSAGDSAMEHHDHEHVKPEFRVPAAPPATERGVRAEWQELSDRATPGPWTQAGHCVTQNHGITILDCWHRGTETPSPEANAALVVVAVNYLRAALAAAAQPTEPTQTCSKCGRKTWATGNGLCESCDPTVNAAGNASL